MTDAINQYGDAFKPTNHGHGVDIASQRQDDLDLRSLQFIRDSLQRGEKVLALDLGGGFGLHALHMAEAGAQVTLIDRTDMRPDAVRTSSVVFVQKDFTALDESDIPQNCNVLYSQRAIHYVPFAEARRILTLSYNRVAKGASVFISAAGWDTEYGKSYPDREKPITQRFNFVTEDMKKKHGISQRIATYKEDDMVALLTESGFSGINVTRSAFGNIKATALKS